MPSYLYTINVKTLNSPKDLIKILMIDTDKICGDHSDEKIYPKGNYLDEVEKAMKEIDQSKVPYFLVSGHYPVQFNLVSDNFYNIVLKHVIILFEYVGLVYIKAWSHKMSNRKIASQIAQI